MSDQMSAADRAVLEQVLAKYGLTPEPESRRSQILGGVGAGAGAAANSMAANRSAQQAAALEEEDANQRRIAAYRQQLLAREQDRREGGAAAFKAQQQAAYVAGGGNAYTPRPGLKSYGFGPVATTDFERANASAYGSEQQNRLAHRDSLTPLVTDPGKFVLPAKKASIWEKLLGIGSAGASIAGSFLKGGL